MAPACMGYENTDRVSSARRVAPGFTLIELLVVIAIVAILLALALPSFREFTIRTTVTQLGNDLVLDLRLAQSEAIKRGIGVALIPNAGGWANGWSVIANTSGTTPSPTYANSLDTTLKTHAALDAGYSMNAAAVGGVSVSPLAFSSTGPLTSPAVQVDFSICRPDKNTALSQLVIVKPSGSVSSQRNVSDSTANMSIACP